MECRRLEITVVSGKDLKDVKLFSKMDVYAQVSVEGEAVYSAQKQKTRVDKDCGPNPTWNDSMAFTIDEESLQKNRVTLQVKIKSDGSFGDRTIGEVFVPLRELMDRQGSNSNPTLVDYAVRTSSGKTKGSLSFSFKLGDKIPAPNKGKYHYEQPATAYPVAAGTAVPPPVQGAYPYPQQFNPYPPPPPQYAYQPQPGYAYPPQPGYPPAGYPNQPYYGGYQKPQKPGRSGANMALGVGAGLLGGLLIGDMISDVGDMASYDAGFSDGLDF